MAKAFIRQLYYTAAIVFMFICIIVGNSCNDPKRPIAVVTNGDTTLVSPIDDSLYIKLHCKYDSLENELITIAKGGIQQRDSLQKENDSLKVIIKTNKLSNCDSLRTALTRANFKVIRVKYYLGLANKNPAKYGVFLRGWINGLFVDQ